MPRSVGPERAHFGGINGVVCVQRGDTITHYWECIYCNWRLGGKNFQNQKARVHLSGDNSLRSGLITEVCKKAPSDIQEQFKKLERVNRQNKIAERGKRKHAAELLASSPLAAASTTSAKGKPKGKRSAQSRLPFTTHKLPDAQVDDAWAKAFFGLNMTPNKIDHELFREAISTTSKSRGG